MVNLRFDQVNVVVSDVLGASRFLRALGAEVQEVPAEWADWEQHHVGVPAAGEGFDVELDSSVFAAHWGGLPRDFVGVVVNVRTVVSAARLERERMR
jgi:hypothetical protein